MPRVRCMWYDDNGAPRERGCTRPNCDFVHPSDPGWFDAPPSRQTVYPRSGSHGSGPSTGPPHDIPRGPRAGKRKHADDERGWNQTDAAATGAPVDGGWGSSKRTNSSWGDSGASGAPTGWGASDASKTSTSGTEWGTGSGWGSTDAGASAWGPVKQAETTSGWGVSESSGTASAGADWGAVSWGDVKSQDSGPGWGSTKDDGAGQPPTVIDDTGKSNAWGAASAAGDVVDKGKGKEKGRTDTWGSGAKTDGGWGGSTWGAATDNDNGGWGSTTSNTGGVGWQGAADAAPSTASPHNADTGISRGFIQPAPVQPQVLADASRFKTELPSTVPGDDNGGWGSASIFSGRESREPGELVEERDVQGTSGWNSEPAASDNVRATKPAALVKDDVLPAGLPFGASTASFIDDTDWPMHSNDTTPSKTEARAPNRSRTSSNAYSRATSPCNSITMARKPSVKDYVKALTRAIQYCQDSNHAKEELVKVKRMEASHAYKQIGERGADILRKTSKDAEHKIRSSKKRLDDALERLDKFPAAAHLPSSSIPDEDVEALCAYTKEALAWIESVRPTIEHMWTEDTTKEVMPDQQPTDPPPLPSSPSDDVKVAALLEKLEALEARLSRLEDDEDQLEEVRKAFIQQQIDERIPLGQSAPGVGPPRDLQPRFEALSQVIKGLQEDVPELKQEVEALKRQQVEELQRLRAEHGELRGKHIQLEAEVSETRQRISTFAGELQSLRDSMEAMSVAQATPPPPLRIEPLALGEWLRPFVVEPIERDIGDVVFGMRRDVEQTLAKSQEDLCKGVWTQLEPALKIMHAVHDTAEKARQNMDVSVLSPELD